MTDTKTTPMEYTDWGTPRARLAIAECLHILRTEVAELNIKMADAQLALDRQNIERPEPICQVTFKATP